jgi:hypothetical protein
MKLNQKQKQQINEIAILWDNNEIIGENNLKKKLLEIISEEEISKIKVIQNGVIFELLQIKNTKFLFEINQYRPEINYDDF